MKDESLKITDAEMLETEVRANHGIIEDPPKQQHSREKVNENLWISKAEMLNWKKDIAEGIVEQVTTQTELLLKKAIRDIMSLKQDVEQLKEDNRTMKRIITKVVKSDKNTTVVVEEEELHLSRSPTPLPARPEQLIQPSPDPREID